MFWKLIKKKKKKRTVCDSRESAIVNAVSAVVAVSECSVHKKAKPAISVNKTFLSDANKNRTLNDKRNEMKKSKSWK